ncbi:unnamed protein product [Oppiella nova]|uniref:Uncharacterized protein n=1 Tax=Oppiella nova TaxID=334625 RepID=A0A7R9M509_9ACAR|nr:unnamed protein product [Oppiella nova]CAG2170905.1 unnamed protein product [Oppiella nova]
MTMVILTSLLYENKSMPSDNMLSALFVSIHCILWSICVAYVIYTCGTGGAPVLNGTLSWKGWLPISKLTYQAYLIHLPLLEYISGIHT